MIVSVNGKQVDFIQPRYAGKNIMVAIDSSKSNSAIAIGDQNGNLIDYVELNGKNDGTKEVDVLHLCLNQRRVLSKLFQDSVPTIVGIENIITKDTDNKIAGISVHMSRFKITAVFMSFISFFQDTFNITPTLVNNQTWKAATLPEEFRKRDYAKGSLAYFKSINSKYQYCSDDVTDSICILEYLCQINGIEKGFKIIAPEAERYTFKHFIISPSKSIRAKHSKFLYNDSMTLEQNAVVMANALHEDEYGLADLRTELLSIDEIYSLCTGQFNNKEDIVRLVVKRTA